MVQRVMRVCWRWVGTGQNGKANARSVRRLQTAQIPHRANYRPTDVPLGGHGLSDLHKSSKAVIKTVASFWLSHFLRYWINSTYLWHTNTGFCFCSCVFLVIKIKSSWTRRITVSMDELVFLNFGFWCRIYRAIDTKSVLKKCHF